MARSPPPASVDPKPGHADLVCLALGGVLLAAGCYLGYEHLANRSWSVPVLVVSIALFATSLALQSRLHRRAARDSVPGSPGAQAQTADKPRPPTETPDPPSLPMSKGEAAPEPRDMALAPETPQAEIAAGPGPLATAALRGAADHVPPGPLDVADLMRVPLADLLLAALCKDPQGARRIFAQAALQTDATVAPATPRSVDRTA